MGPLPLPNLYPIYAPANAAPTAIAFGSGLTFSPSTKSLSRANFWDNMLSLMILGQFVLKYVSKLN